jgi:DNA polymerase III subunit gamma/tau
MAELVLYRKYRPKKFKDVLGQDHIVRVLEGAISQDNVAHAYLFAGSRGTGKTSVARILAAEIGCSANDLHEMDAASNRGIDDVRELREAVNVMPIESAHKVYIIDEAHMLTKDAFNALLKTLEEPPKHVVFVLATTEIEKLPDTIVSRCQHFSFQKPSVEILKKVAEDISAKEGYAIEPEAAELAAIIGDGSFRDMQGILQKVFSSTKDKKVSLADIGVVTGAPKSELVNRIISAIGENDPKSGLSALQSASRKNIDARILLMLVLQKIRAILLFSYAPELAKEAVEHFSEEDSVFLKNISERGHITAETLRTLLRAYDEAPYYFEPMLALELALISLHSDVDNTAVSKQ